MNLVLEWNELAIQAVRDTKPGPPMAARSLSVVASAMYDAWAPYDNVAKPWKSTVPRRPVGQRTVPNREKAISMAAYRALVDQFPSVDANFSAKLVAKLATVGLSPGDTTTNLNNPAGVGNQASTAVLNFRHSDGANQAGNYADTTGYVAPNPPMIAAIPAAVDAVPYPGKWQPLTYLSVDHVAKTPTFIGPHWGLVKPFALTSSSQFRPSPPQSEFSQGFLEQARWVMEVQANLTPRQKVIAEYWADGPNSELPPGHWNEFASFVAVRDNMGLDDTIKLMFVVGNAIGDAAIATWEAKRFYDYVRPITAIRHLFRGKQIRAWGGPGMGTIDIDGSAWRPFQVPTFPTPPFAEYTSGHSAFSRAGAEVLKRFTGSDKFGFFYAQTKPLAADPTVPVGDVILHWSTFTEAAQEAGESRLYGGIHFYEGNVAGLGMGRSVGEVVYQKAEQLWTGA
ncbi:MAG: vanadium-dependent haloperoxidase [Bryobacteraceae bacterium]